MLNFTEFRPESETVAGLNAAIAKAEKAMAESLALAERARCSIGEQVLHGTADDVAEARRVASMARGDAADLENVIEALRAALPAARDRDALAEVRRIEAELAPTRAERAAALAEYDRHAQAICDLVAVIEQCDIPEARLESALRAVGDNSHSKDLPECIRSPRLRGRLNIPNPKGGDYFVGVDLLDRVNLPFFIEAHEQGKAAREAAAKKASSQQSAPPRTFTHLTPFGGRVADAKNFSLPSRE